MLDHYYVRDVRAVPAQRERQRATESAATVAIAVTTPRRAFGRGASSSTWRPASTEPYIAITHTQAHSSVRAARGEQRCVLDFPA